MTGRLVRIAAPFVLLAIHACAEPCVEDIRAQELDERRVVTIRGPGGVVEVEAEIAQTDVERERGWKHRVCGLHGGALALVPDEPAPLQIWMCDVTIPLDLLFVRDGEVVHVERAASPCPAPCGECPLFGPQEPVEFGLELPHDDHAEATFAIGDRVDGVL